MGAALFRHEHDRHHQHEGHQDDRQIDLPQFARVQPAGLGQQRRRDHEQRHLHQMQHEYAEVQPQQVGMQQHLARPGRLHGAGLGARHHRHDPARHGQADHAQTGDGPEQARQPHQPTSTGDSTSETAKDRPIEPPTMAMARVRTSSRVASASQAVTAAEMAPAPWMARPMVIQNTSDAWAQTTLPATNSKGRRSPRAGGPSGRTPARRESA